MKRVVKTSHFAFFPSVVKIQCKRPPEWLIAIFQRSPNYSPVCKYRKAMRARKDTRNNCFRLLSFSTSIKAPVNLSHTLGFEILAEDKENSIIKNKHGNPLRK